MTSRSAYGGQAVIEGVMIRGKERYATACRKPSDVIVYLRDAVTTVARHPIWRLAFLRGTPGLIDSFSLGYKTLMWSAEVAMEGEEEKKQATPGAALLRLFGPILSLLLWSADADGGGAAPAEKKPHELAMTLTMIGSVLIAVALFVAGPTALMGPVARMIGAHATTGTILQQLTPSWAGMLYNLLEGVLRLLALVIYILVVARNPEVRRVFAYHGAEHKVVNGYEFEADLTVDAVRPYSRIHPRCGTSFIFLFFVVGILVHAAIGWPAAAWLRIVSRLLLIPVIAGIAYELIRLAGRFRDSVLLKILVWPGMMLQRLTTAEPADEQIEVAIASLRAVLEDEGVLPAPSQDSPGDVAIA